EGGGGGQVGVRERRQGAVGLDQRRRQEALHVLRVLVGEIGGGQHQAARDVHVREARREQVALRGGLGAQRHEVRLRGVREVHGGQLGAAALAGHVRARALNGHRLR